MEAVPKEAVSQEAALETLRELLQERLKRELFYAQSGLSSDHAVGTALLARDLYQKQSR